jgi:hypothetical protein
LEVAPYPTIFIGGNHEASNYLWELWVSLFHILFVTFHMSLRTCLDSLILTYLLALTLVWVRLIQRADENGLWYLGLVWRNCLICSL